VSQEPDNWVTTLADSVRVGDDFGKFRIQYELHEPLIGMHGSFVVCQNAVERLVTFDHGMEGSITEDAFFALVAQVKGIKFSWYVPPVMMMMMMMMLWLLTWCWIVIPIDGFASIDSLVLS
jgi:hypothetical protein